MAKNKKRKKNTAKTGKIQKMTTEVHQDVSAEPVKKTVMRVFMMVIACAMLIGIIAMPLMSLYGYL